MGKTIIRNMTEGSVFRQLAAFSLPLLLANSLQTLYTTVDTLVVGRFVGTAALSAVSTCGELVNFYSMIGMGLASAGQIIIAQFVGKDDKESVGKTIGAMFSTLTVLAVLFSALCILTLDRQLQWIKLPAEALADGRRYTLVSAVGFVFIYGYNAVSAALRGMGDSKRPLLFVAIASVANLLLDLLFVLGFGWGAFGAALATILGQGFSLVSSVIYLYRRKDAFCFDFRLRSFRPERRYLKMLLQLGVPTAAQFAAILISVLFIGAQINSFGVAASASNGIANKLENILRIVSNSVGTAGSAMIAQNLAAKQHKRVEKILGWVMVICVSWAALCSAAILLLPRQIFSLFNRDAAVLEYAVIYGPVGVLCYMSNGLRATANALINGIGFAALSLTSGLLDGVAARIGFSLLLGVGFGMGLLGFWIGSALAGYVPVVIGLVYFLSGRWKTHRLITHQENEKTKA